jgi:hypothetical protein
MREGVRTHEVVAVHGADELAPGKAEARISGGTEALIVGMARQVHA